jgi:membrane fusion protein (multidrug efflux system)
MADDQKPSTPAAPPSAPTSAPPPPPNPKRKRALTIVAGLVVLAALGFGGYAFVFRNEESTDDAQVDADVVNVSARVAAPVLKVVAQDNALVKKGDVIVELDTTDLDIRVRQADAELTAAQAQADVADAQVHVSDATTRGGFSGAHAAWVGSAAAARTADANIDVAKAAQQRAKAESERAMSDYDRNNKLFNVGGVTQAALDNARTSRDAAVAAQQQADAQLQAALDGKESAESRVAEAHARLVQTAPIDAQLRAAQSQADLAHARVKAAEAALDAAKNQVGYAKIVSPVDGLLSKIAVRAGQNVAPGQLVVAVVPSATYVVANFKETQVGKMRAGQRAEVTLDAARGHKLKGTVAAISPATGARFSLLPPDNASGNFVKVVQRVPVRIAWDGTPDVPLAAGLSAEVVVHTD